MSTLQIQENVPLAPLTTLGVGGPARFFAAIHSEQDLSAAVAFARLHRLPLFTLGGGSNLLVHDEGFPGLILHLVLEGQPEITASGEDVVYKVPAGLSWDTLVDLSCEPGLSGIECLAGIPGLTGGTPVQNVGAYGQEVAQTIRSVRAFDLQTNTFVLLSNQDCRFRYRSSLFNAEAAGRYLLTAVTFAFRQDATPTLTYADLTRRFAGQQPTPAEVAAAVREIRRSKGMLVLPGDPDTRSAGSFFKNPLISTSHFQTLTANGSIPHWPVPGQPGQIKLAAAWLVEQAGFHKGFTLGQAGISSRHTLALINRGRATFHDIAALRDLIRAEVHRRFAIHLEQEPIELGPA